MHQRIGCPLPINRRPPDRVGLGLGGAQSASQRFFGNAPDSRIPLIVPARALCASSALIPLGIFTSVDRGAEVFIRLRAHIDQLANQPINAQIVNARKHFDLSLRFLCDSYVLHKATTIILSRPLQE